MNICSPKRGVGHNLINVIEIWMIMYKDEVEMEIPQRSDERMRISREGDRLIVVLGGRWCTSEGLQGMSQIEEEIKGDGKLGGISFKVEGISDWDTSLVSFLVRCQRLCRERGIEFFGEELPENIKQLLLLSRAVPRMKEVEVQRRRSFLEVIGQSAINFVVGCVDVLTFLGKSTISIGRVMTGAGQARWRDFWVVIQEVGIEALPIVTLISFLVGFILAFVGFAQLERFGATIYVADLVGLAMVREMGAVMAGVIMCGRTGGAFAATLGTMKVREEIDALKTTGISPYDFLVVPRILALSLMMPLLCIYADIIGILGGVFVTISIGDVTFIEYINETREAIDMTHISVGLYKSVVFGILIAVTGCLRGMQCRRSASGVGDAATSAVVTGITSLVVADAIFAILFDVLDM